MDTSQFLTNRKVRLFAGGFLLLLGFGLGLLLRSMFPAQIPASSPIPSSAVGLLQTNTPTVLPATNTPIVITPTATASPPQPTPAESSLPAEFLARLTLGEIEAFALSPQLDRLIVASASHTCLFTTESYERVWCSLTIPQMDMAELEMGTSDPRIRGVVFRPDGSQVAITLWNGYIVFLDATNGEQVNIIPTGRWIYNLAWSSDGKRIITHSNQGGIEVWDASSGVALQQLTIDPESLMTMAWSADGTVFATADEENVITFWDAEKYEPTGKLAVQTTGWIRSMAWSPDKSKIYAGIATPFPCEENCDPNEPEYKGWVASWFVENGYLASKTSVGDIIKTLSVSPDGKWVAAGGELLGSFVILDGSTSTIHARLNDTNAGKSVGWLDNNRALYLPDPRHIDSMSISEWDVRLSEHTEVFLPGYENIRSMAWLPEGDRILTNSTGGTLSLWQPRTSQRLDQFQLSFGDLPITEFGPTWISPVDPRLVVGTEDSLAIVDLEKRRVLKWLDHKQIAPRVRVVDFVWSQDGSKIAGLVGYLDRVGLTAAVWDSVTGELLFKAPEEDHADINVLSFSPDGGRLVLSKNFSYPEYKHSLAVVKIDSGEEVQSLDSDTQVFWVYWFTQDRIAFDGCNKTLIWDLAQGIQIESTLPSRFPAFRSDGKLAAFPCPGEGISVWGFPNGKEVGCLQGQTDGFGYRSLFFSPNGELLASLTDGGSLIVWDTSKFPLPQITVTTAPPTLTPSSTPAPATPTKQPGLTPSKTAAPTILPSPTATTGITPTHTPFSRDLDHYFLKYDPNATPDMPTIWSISSWNIWGSIIPATPVEATPQFVDYPPPADLATNAQDLFIQAGCKIDTYGMNCPPESQLSRYDCWWIFWDPSWIAFPTMPDLSLVAECATEIDYSEKAPEDLYIAGCAFKFKVGYIFKIKEEYVLVNTIEQMKELFVPIESASAALSYAQMMTGLDAPFEFSFDTDLLYLQESIKGTHVTEANGSYIMNLYHSQACGCEPFMTSEVILQVDRDGTITWNSAIPVYFTTGFSCAD